jgi:tetratricopeptide (TPR) repeat protein
VAGAELSREINRAWLGIATQSVFQCLLMKYLEIPASYALVAGDVPRHGRALLGDDFLPLHPEQSDAEILAALRAALADKDALLEKIDRAHARVLRQRSTDAFAGRVLDTFRQALARRAPRPAGPSARATGVAPLPQPDGDSQAGQGIRLSLCMIVRDNAGTIRAALESIRPWVDEMVVVDTGSKDDTPAIAERLGARVFHFPWCDDFSAARNESLRHARGEWVVWMDSDDTIDPDNARRLRELVQKAHDPRVLGYVVSVRCPGPGPEGDSDVTVVQHVKLFRNLPQLRFDGRIHEQVLPAIRALGGEVAWTDLFVVHSGYDHSPEGQKRKLERDLRLLHLELQERPNHPFTLFNLAMTCTDAGRYEDGVRYARGSIAGSAEGSHLRKAYAYLVCCHDKLGQKDAAWQACLEGLGKFPLDDELRFRRGALLQGRGQLKEAAQAYLELLGTREEAHFGSVVDGIAGHLARHNLALVYRDLGDLAGEEQQWRLAVGEKPHYRPGWRGLGDVLVRRGDLDGALAVAEQLMGNGHLRGEGRLIRSAVSSARGDHRAAREELEQALAERPGDTDLLEALCRLLFERGDPAEAERALRELARRCPDNASAQHNLGLVCLRLRRPEEATQAFQEALRLRPDAAHTHLHLGQALKEAGRLAEACAAWEAALRLEPDNQAARAELGQAQGPNAG